MTSKMTRTLVFGLGACVVSLLAFAAPASAKESQLDAVFFEGKKLRLDGMLKEWPELVELSELVSGAGGKDPKARGLVGYDADKLYVGMRITDAELTRTSSFGNNEDRASLKLAFPRRNGGYKVYHVSLYPGVPGQSSGSVRLPGAGNLPGSQIVEAPSADGLSFEAVIPWSAFPEAKEVRSGLRGALLYHDSDGGTVKTVIGTSKKNGAELPLLTIEAEYGLHHALVFPKGLDVRPQRELLANLTGGPMLERVAVYERYLAVTGWGFRKGKEFFYQDLNLMSPRDLKEIAAADFDGDGRDELVIHRRVGSAGKARNYVEVWSFQSDEQPPRAIFQHEVGIVESDAEITNQVEIQRKGPRPGLVISQGSHSKVVPDEWSAPSAGEGTLPTLMPWEPVAFRRYEWTGAGFELVKEQAGKPKLEAPRRGTKLFSGSRSAHDPLPSDNAAPPEPPRPPSAGELLDQVYALYRREHGAPKGKPSFDFVTNVAGDETPERVLVHGKDLVVFGKKFKDGTSYVYTTIGVKDPKDILDVTARDVTGDGTADVIVRALLHAQASKAMGGKVVTRHALFIYDVQQHVIIRIFAAETGRSLEGNTILGHVRFTPVGRALWIDLLPGRAIGWTEKTYPFPEDRTPYGGLEPLLLPWSTNEPRRYGFRGGEFKPR